MTGSSERGPLLEVADQLLVLVYDREAATSRRVQAARRWLAIEGALRRHVRPDGRSPTGDADVDALAAHTGSVAGFLRHDPRFNPEPPADGTPLRPGDQPTPPPGWAPR